MRPRDSTRYVFGSTARPTPAPATTTVNAPIAIALCRRTDFSTKRRRSVTLWKSMRLPAWDSCSFMGCSGVATLDLFLSMLKSAWSRSDEAPVEIFEREKIQEIECHQSQDGPLETTAGIRRSRGPHRDDDARQDDREHHELPDYGLPTPRRPRRRAAAGNDRPLLRRAAAARI